MKYVLGHLEREKCIVLNLKPFINYNAEHFIFKHQWVLFLQTLPLIQLKTEVRKITW